MARIAVIGLGRSGTSFVAQALGESGCHLGKVNWAYENLAAREVNDAWAQKYRGAIPGVLPCGWPGRFESPPANEVALETTRVTVELHEARGNKRHSLIKCPKTTLFWPFWQLQFDVVIGVFRDPRQSASSYLRRDFIKQGSWDRWTLALQYWKEFSSIVLDATYQRTPRAYLLHFDETIEAQLRRLCEALGLEYNTGLKYDGGLPQAVYDYEITDPAIPWLYEKLKHRHAQMQDRFQ